MFSVNYSFKNVLKTCLFQIGKSRSCTEIEEATRGEGEGFDSRTGGDGRCPGQAEGVEGRAQL